MIVFDLACDCGYQFEGWFQGREDFELQQGSGMLQCPECGSAKIHKILSPVTAVRSNVNTSDQPEPAKAEPITEETVSSALGKLQDFVLTHYENVGAKFAEESLKIHYGVEKARNIRGVATKEEEKILKNEGIEIVKIPLPGKDNDEKPN